MIGVGLDVSKMPGAPVSMPVSMTTAPLSMPMPVNMNTSPLNMHTMPMPVSMSMPVTMPMTAPVNLPTIPVSTDVAPTLNNSQQLAIYDNTAAAAAKKAQQEAKAAAAERKKRADEYDALELMQKVTDGQGVAVTTIPNRPSPNNIFVFSSHKRKYL